jgi:hypothetical protein
MYYYIYISILLIYYYYYTTGFRRERGERRGERGEGIGKS